MTLYRRSSTQDLHVLKNIIDPIMQFSINFVIRQNLPLPMFVVKLLRWDNRLVLICISQKPQEPNKAQQGAQRILYWFNPTFKRTMHKDALEISSWKINSHKLPCPTCAITLASEFPVHNSIIEICMLSGNSTPERTHILLLIYVNLTFSCN